jgi:hypothetical protein
MVDVCPICNRDVAADRLSQHVWTLHLRYWGHCWCGKRLTRDGRSLNQDRADFADHCLDLGGYLAHYLECQLRGENG